MEGGGRGRELLYRQVADETDGGPRRWGGWVELVEEEGCRTGLPEEEGFQEALEGFGLSKWKNGCHALSP